jgi:hypothetical protein
MWRGRPARVSPQATKLLHTVVLLNLILLTTINDKPWCRSQIAEPIPIPVSTPEFHKPPTRQVENSHIYNPHGLYERQVVTVPERFRRKICDHRAVQNRLVKSESNQDRHYIEEIKVQDIVKERHPAKHQQNPTETACRFDPVK